MSITLYSADACPYCVRTRLVLGGKGIEYDLVQVDLSDKPAWLRELNPRNRVPVLDVDGQVLWESEALNDYLDETHPEPAMMPSDPVERARVRIVLRRFEDLSDAFYAARRGRGRRDRGAARRAWHGSHRSSRTAATWSATRYTLAEPGVWPWITRLYRVGVDIGQYPAIAAWCDRLAERPEYAAELSLLAA